MLNKISDVLAKIFHPVFMVFYIALPSVLMDSGDLKVSKLNIIAIVFVGTILLPILFTYIYTHGNLFIEDRKKRTIPLLATIFSYILTLIIVFFFAKNSIINYFFAIFITGLILVLLINFKFKISMHASAYGSTLAILLTIITVANIFGSIYHLLILLFLTITIIALVLRQRYISGAHTIVEIVSGFLLGLSVSFAYIYLSIYHSFLN